MMKKTHQQIIKQDNLFMYYSHTRCLKLPTTLVWKLVKQNWEFIVGSGEQP